MKYINIPLLVLVFLFLNAGCCYENECVSERGLNIELKGYTNGQYDLKIERFFKNGNFDTPIDEFTFIIDWSGNLSENLPMGPNFEHESDYYDYKFTILEDGNSFTITNLEIDRNATDRKCGLIKTMEAYVCPYAMLNVGGPKVSLDDRLILLTK